MGRGRFRRDSDLQQVLPERDGDGLGAAGDVHLLEERPRHGVDAVRANAEHGSDFLACLSVDNHLNSLQVHLRT